MTDYLPYTSGEYAVDAPATALHFERWFRNWEAGFEGAINAPRLAKEALGGSLLGAIYGATTTWAGLTGLERIEEVSFKWNIPGSNTTNPNGLLVRFTNDQGATWGASQTLVSYYPGSQQTFGFTGESHLNLVTGAHAGMWGSDTRAVGVHSGTLTVPSGCNGFQIRSILTAAGNAHAALVFARKGRAA